MTSGEAPTTLLVTATGRDRPGVTAALFAAATAPGVDVLDVEQVVVRGHLTLGFLLGTSGASPQVQDAMLARLAVAAQELDVTVATEPGTGETPGLRGARLHVTMLGRPLSPDAVRAVTGELAERGANVDRIRRLASDPVTALELDVSGVPDLAQLRRDLTRAAVGHGADVAVSPAGIVRHGRRLVVMDVDSTLIQDEVIELLAAEAGREAEVAAVTERAMRGELDFAESLHERVAALAGLPVSAFAAVQSRVRLTPGARTLVRTLHELGFTVALVSGGFMEVVGPLARSLGIVNARANRLEVADGRLTGRVLGTVMDRPGKATALRDFARHEGLAMSRTVAIGDGANDLDMLGAAGLGIAFNAKPVVREQADASLTGPYLDSVLFLLGLSADEIADAQASA
ncbi:phosphoserine phosphatase SerB [Aquipuribacter sp. MA13-6]|uniref:phosphoserine phosphatase SerB n=1 Tax=unclassified Aquipuribacter TaxID=2635084 RepID=UPI003EE8D6DB